MIDRFQISVSNIGTIYSGSDRTKANIEFTECCQMVDSHYGRTSGETVTFMADGDVHAEHHSICKETDND